MSKYEVRIKGHFDRFTQGIVDGILNQSLSASLEDKSYYTNGSVKVAVYVFERYSYLGKNRVSLNLTVVGDQQDLFISAITSGGSQAVFFKINTFGEDAFLESARHYVEEYENEYEEEISIF